MRKNHTNKQINYEKTTKLKQNHTSSLFSSSNSSPPPPPTLLNLRCFHRRSFHRRMIGQKKALSHVHLLPQIFHLFWRIGGWIVSSSSSSSSSSSPSICQNKTSKQKGLRLIRWIFGWRISSFWKTYFLPSFRNMLIGKTTYKTTPLYSPNTVTRHSRSTTPLKHFLPEQIHRLSWSLTFSSFQIWSNVSNFPLSLFPQCGSSTHQPPLGWRVLMKQLRPATKKAWYQH